MKRTHQILMLVLLLGTLLLLAACDPNTGAVDLDALGLGDLPEINLEDLPEIELPEIKLPEVKLPEVKLPEIDLEDAILDNLTPEDVGLGDLGLGDVTLGDLKDGNFDISAFITTAPPTTAVPPDPNAPTGVDIRLATLSLSGTEVSGAVPNGTEIFFFAPEVTVADGATCTITLDVLGRDVVYSKTVPLEVGDNTFYILVENRKDVGFYRVTLRRRPLFSLTLMEGTEVVKECTPEEGTAIADLMAELARPGYLLTLYTDSAMTLPLAEGATVTEDLTLYLGYTPAPPPEEPIPE